MGGGGEGGILGWSDSKFLSSSREVSIVAGYSIFVRSKVFELSM